MKLILSNRQFEILKMIVSSYNPVEINAITARFKKSERTIRYDINSMKDQLNDLDIELKHKSKAGYYIPASQKTTCLQLMNDSEIQDKMVGFGDNEESRYYSIFMFLITHNHKLAADEIATQFYVSRSTLLRMFKNFDDYFENKVRLSSSKALGYQIEGDEFELRLLASHYLSETLIENYSVEDWYMCLSKDIKEIVYFNDIEKIVHTIKKLNTSYNVWITNTAFVNLLSYCIISEVRIRRKCVMNTHSIKKYEDQALQEKGYAYELLYELFGEPVSDYEIGCLVDMLNKNKILVSSTTNITIPLEDILDEMLNVVKLEKNIAFDLTTLRSDLSEHLNRFISLSEIDDQNEDNHVVEEIRNKYASYYELALKCSKILSQRIARNFSEIEICYVAIYLYKNVIRTNDASKRILVVCATGKGLSHLVSTRIKNVFSNLTIVAQISPYQLDSIHQWKNIDFVVSTIPLKNCAYPVVKVSKILSTADIQRIQSRIQYGEFVDSMPFNQANIASFNFKDDPYSLNQVNASYSSDIEAASTIISKLILTLIDYTAKFPKPYQMSQDALLGLIIHVSLAFPRWFHPNQESDESVDELYHQLASEHPSLFSLMDKFFQVVEETLMVELTYSERYAFYLYIINEENNNEKTVN